MPRKTKISSPTSSEESFDAQFMKMNQVEPPKRNRSAFILYSLAKRKELKNQGYDSTNSNSIMIQVASLWKTLDSKERAIYEAEAKREKDRYYEEMAKFEASLGGKAVINRTKKNHLKKPCSCYGIFLRDNKEAIKKKNPQMKMSEILKLAAEEWKKLGQEGKNQYKEIAKKEKEAFEAENGDFHRVYRKRNNNVVEKKPKKATKKSKKEESDSEDEELELDDIEEEEESENEEVCDKKFKTETDNLMFNVSTVDTVNTCASTAEDLITGTELLNSIDFSVFIRESYEEARLEDIFRTNSKIVTAKPYGMEPPSLSAGFLGLNKKRNDMVVDLINFDMVDDILSHCLDFNNTLLKINSTEMF